MDPPTKRKRQVNYAENEYFRNALKAPGRAQGGPRLPKMPALQDFQFYNLPRLTEIYDQEQAYELHKHSQGQKEAALRSQVSSPSFLGHDDPLCHLCCLIGMQLASPPNLLKFCIRQLAAGIAVCTASKNI